MANNRRTQAKTKILKWYEHIPLLEYVINKLTAKSHYSPEQIAGRIKLDNPDDEKMRISHESIYQYVWTDKQNGGKLWKCLRQSHKKKKKRYGKKDARGIIANRISSDGRPKEVEAKEITG